MPKPTGQLQVGSMVANKYHIDRVLGVGGMGVVFAATHRQLRRSVAIKVIREELLGDAAVTQRLMREARAAATIQSEHVGRVLDVGTLDSGAPFIVMEHLEGMDLSQHLAKYGPLPIQQAVDFLLQACEAIAEAHRANIIHRDLKPENLFVAQRSDGSTTIKVLDFGISKYLGDSTRHALTQARTAVGSPQYMSPEQMRAQPVDARSDVWALGAILFELLSGGPAFDGDTVPQVCAQVLNTDPPPLTEVASVPELLAAAVDCCLKKDPLARFRSISALSVALAPFGSEGSQISMERIVALDPPTSLTSQGPNPLPQPRITRALTRDKPLPAQDEAAGGAGATGDAGATGNSSQPGTPAHSQGVARTVGHAPASAIHKPSRLPVWLTLVGVGLTIVAIILLWSDSDKVANEDQTVEGAPAPAAPFANPQELSDTSSAGVSPEPRLSSPLPVQMPQPADSASPSAATVPPSATTAVLKATPSRPPTPRQPRSGAAQPTPKKKAASPQAKSPQVDAWDPDSFGKRH